MFYQPHNLFIKDGEEPIQRHELFQEQVYFRVILPELLVYTSRSHSIFKVLAKPAQSQQSSIAFICAWLCVPTGLIFFAFDDDLSCSIFVVYVFSSYFYYESSFLGQYLLQKQKRFEFFKKNHLSQKYFYCLYSLSSLSLSLFLGWAFLRNFSEVFFSTCIVIVFLFNILINLFFSLD